MKRVSVRFSYRIIYLWSLWPLKIHYLFADVLYFFLYRIIRYRYGAVVTNISRSFPEMKYAEVEKTARGFYRYLADLVAETVWSVSASEKSIAAHTAFEGTDELEKAYLSDRCTVTMLGHFQNWEIWTCIPDLKKYYDTDIPNSCFNISPIPCSNGVQIRKEKAPTFL